ncbi:Brp/Blh family beta-carotene 15,15'-dioxygenase, partial [Candidatus Pelagibacter sp.]|nr:Brp/Blh family beta-carotene 15,15'-dioxygenase [Candidatus Pelagibacter sp.]
MHSVINKINLYHSVIFFIFSCFIALVVNQFENIIISPVICLFLIISIGISHGALDDQKGKKLSQLYNIKKSYFFYLTYSFIGISIIIFWLFFPTVSLILFLIVASYHFGKEDSEFLINNNNKLNLILYFLKGSLIIIAPLMFHFV